MNSDYILKKVRPYLNKNNEISSKEFLEAFGMLTRKEQYKVIDILIENDIEYVDEKKTEPEEPAEHIKPLILLGEKDIHLKNEQLCLMYQHGDASAMEMLLIKNQRFIYKIVLKAQKPYQHKLDIEDLLQEGKLGLIIAAERFDVDKGFTFLTYAEDWIRQRVIRCIINEGYTIRLPVHVFEKINKIANLERYCGIEDEEERIEYICQETGLTPNEIYKYLKYADQLLNPIMFNQYVGGEEDTELLEFIPDEQKQVDELVIDTFMRKDIDDMLGTITPREEKVIRMRVGLDDGKEYTLEEIGQVFNVTRERIRQIEAKSLRKLRHPSRSKRLKDYIL